MDKKKLITGIVVTVVLIGVIIGLKVFKDSSEKGVQIAQSEGVKDVDVLWDGKWDLEELKTEKKPILLDFTASWCVPCKTFNPILEQTKKELGDKVIIKIIDVDEFPEVSKQYPVRVIPSQVLINADGTPFEPTEDLKIYGFLGYSKDGSTGNDLTLHEGAMSKDELTRLLAAMDTKAPTTEKEKGE